MAGFLHMCGRGSDVLVCHVACVSAQVRGAQSAASELARQPGKENISKREGEEQVNQNGHNTAYASPCGRAKSNKKPPSAIR